MEFKKFIEKTNPFRKTERGDSLIGTILLLFHFCVAVAAINRSVVAGLEGNLCFFATTSASSGEKFSCGLACVLLSGTAGFASLGFVLETFFCVKFLFTCGEYEFVAAILAYQCLVLIHFVFTSL
jgi:hypothetical protein